MGAAPRIGHADPHRRQPGCPAARAGRAAPVEWPGGPKASTDLPARIGELEAFISANNPADADLYLELAAIYRVQGDEDASRRTLMRALDMLDAIGNDDPRIRVNEALRSLDIPLEPSAQGAGAPQAHMQELQQLIDAEQPQDVAPYLELATLLPRAGRHSPSPAHSDARAGHADRDGRRSGCAQCRHGRAQRAAIVALHRHTWRQATHEYLQRCTPGGVACP